MNDESWAAPPPPPRRKFQHNWRRHITLFVLTLVTTTLAPNVEPWLYGVPITWAGLLSGFWFSIPLLTFLSAHEFGHYFACRAHNVDATLPYYIPAPVPMTGTFGAVIRIREAFPSKRALFDIGVAGPIAGFIALVPLLVWAIWTGEVGPVPPGPRPYLGEPLLLKFLTLVRFGIRPEGTDLFLSNMGLAAWWGMLATALNLLPFGQLDGGHIMYAAVGRRASLLSAVTLGFVLLLMVRSMTWFMPALMMVVMAFIFGFRHPRIIDEHEPLDPGRRVIAVFAVVIFILCFTPVPIDVLGE